MSQLLGPDLLVRNGDVFIKRPGCVQEIDWHVDSSFPWDRSEGLATCWIGLTPATQDNGGVQYIPESHRHVFTREPMDRFDLTLSAEMVSELDLSSGIQGIMDPGQMAVHAFRTVHRSEANRSDDRRIGMVLRFMAARTFPDVAECGQAFLVQGDPGAWSGKLRPEFPISWSIH
jgi:ectoine hydroxylase-related dioxygenase (phytanoyl-CoA dioxygenase family)